MQFSNTLYYQNTLSKLKSAREFEKKMEYFFIKEFVLILEKMGKAGKRVKKNTYEICKSAECFRYSFPIATFKTLNTHTHSNFCQ